MNKLETKNYNMILTEKQPYHQKKFINMTVSLVKINQQLIIEQAKFTYSPLGKALEKQIKTIEHESEKSVKELSTLKYNNEKLTIEDVIPKSALNNNEAEKEIDKIKEIENSIDREKLIYKSNKYTYDFRKFQTIRTFGKDIYEGKITLEEADKDQSDLLNDIKNFSDKTRPKNYKKKNKKKKLQMIICINLILQKKWFLMALKLKYFQ